MKIYPTLSIPIAEAFRALDLFGHEVKTEKWHGQSNDKPMVETLNYTLCGAIPTERSTLHLQTKANLPWAEDHFKERVGGRPLNPPPSHKHWPYRVAGNAVHTEAEGGKFSHTYPERFWPRWAGATPPAAVDDGNQGIRYRYGDYEDVVNLLAREPYTRQAFLPVWFPEDTGVNFNGRVPCTIGYHLIRRESWLHCVYFIRSCDIMRHFRDDVYLAARLVQHTLKQLTTPLALYPHAHEQWARVIPGSLTMHITSLHCFVAERGVLRSHYESTNA